MKTNKLNINLKSFLNKALVILAFCFLGNLTNVFAQEQVNFYFNNNKPEQKINKSENKQIRATFYVSGLNSSQEVQQFINGFIGQPYVNSFTISEEMINGKRSANISLSTLISFKELLEKNKVHALIFKDQEILVKDMNSILFN